MIFQLLWALIGFFTVLGYLILWIQQWRNNNRPVLSRFSNSSPRDLTASHTTVLENKPYETPFNPETEITDLDADIVDDFGIDSTGDYVLDLDEMDNDDINEPNLHYQRSFDNDFDALDSCLPETEDKDDFLVKRKVSLKSRYYTTCTLACEKNQEFIKAPERTALSIEDADNQDYWITENPITPSSISVVPRCCLSSSADGSLITPTLSKKRNNRESFREDILQISNKNQESMMKRKYAVADLIESDREYCASLKLIKDILSSLDDSKSQFQKGTLESFSALLETITALYETHEKKILPNLSTCTMNPANVANILLEEKSNLRIYSKLIIQWIKLKIEIQKMADKHIFLTNNSTYESSKISVLSFIDIMKSVEDKLSQYSSFLCDIMRYTGRVGGDVYDIQKAITMLNRIKRCFGEQEFFKKLEAGKDYFKKDERLIRMTDSVTVSEPKMIKRNGEMISLVKEKLCDLILTKNKLVFCEDSNSGLMITDSIEIQSIKLFHRDIDEDNITILWTQVNDQKYNIFLLHFKSKFSKKTWVYEISRRLIKSGKRSIFVSSEDYESQYQQFVLKNQRLAAIEMESVSLESATVDAPCTPPYTELYEEMTSSFEISSDINFESAIMETPSPLTSTSYKTAKDKLKSSTDKGPRPISGISQDSISTLDGVRTPFEDEESLRLVTITSDTKSINLKEDSDITLSLTFNNFEKDFQSVLWSLNDVVLDTKDPDVTVKLNERTSKVIQCQFLKKTKRPIKSGSLTCKIVDKINGMLLASSTTDIIVSPPSAEIELTSAIAELVVKERESIHVELKIMKEPSAHLNINDFVWCKDNEIIKIDNSRIKCDLQENEGVISLQIFKATQSDAGIYTIESGNIQRLHIRNSNSISILVLIEMVKKPIYRTASQENPTQLEQTDLDVISPMKDPESISKFSNENKSNDNCHSVVTVTKIKDVMASILKVKSDRIEVNENSQLVLEVEIVENLDVDPLWYFNKELLIKNENLKFTYSSGKGTARLTIEKCSKKNEGIYTISVTSSTNNSKECADVAVVVVEKKKSGCLECDVEEIDLKTGETLQLNLRPLDIEEAVLKSGSWFLNSKILDVKKMKGEFNVTKDLLTLNIPDANKDVIGVLQFKIEKPKVICSPEIQIRIRDGDKKALKLCQDELKLKEVRASVDVTECEELLLDCEVIAGDVAMYQSPKWTLDNVAVASTRCKSSMDGSHYKLNIKMSEVKDSGIYKCTFSPGKGTSSKEVSASFTVKVNKESKKAPIPPIINAKSEKIEVDEFNDAILEMNIGAKLDEDPTWYFNKSSVITKNNQFTIKNDEGSSKLIIKKSEKSNEGVYTCTVVNPVNKLKECADIVLRVIQPQKSGFLDCDIEELDLKTGEILKLNLNAVGLEESVLKTGCWYLNSKILDLKKCKGEFTVTKDLLTLYIPDVKKDVTGSLQFKIDKPTSLCSPEITIKIRDADNKSLKSSKDDLTVKEVQPHVEIMENEDLLLDVEIVSGNQSTYQSPKWTLNDEAVNRNSRITIDSKHCTLSLKSCQLKDSGNYKCTFTPLKKDSRENVTASFFVVIQRVNRKLVVANSQIEVVEGDSVTLCVEAEGFLEKDIKWTSLGDKEKSESKIVDDRMKEKFNNNLALLLIDSVQPSDAGTYICKGFLNKELKSEATITLKVRPSDLNAAKCLGRFDKELYVVDEGDDSILRVAIACSSVHYSVSWFFNSEVIEMKSNISTDITENGSIAELIIKNCGRSHAGRYKCSIESKDLHVSTTETTLQVKDKVEKFIVKVLEGEKLRLSVSIDKELEGCVTEWSKNDVRLDEHSGFLEVKGVGDYSINKEASTLEECGTYLLRFLCDSAVIKEVEFIVIVDSITDEEKVEKIRLICDENEIVAKETEPLIISIEVDKWQVATVQWLLNGELYGNSYELDSQFIDLYVDSPKHELHAGTFKCQVTNKYKDISYVDIHVTFDDDKDTTEDDVELLSCTVEEVDLVEGYPLQISINSKDRTQSTIKASWYKDNCLLDEKDPRLSMVVQPHNYNLIVSTSRLTDSGVYCLKVDGNSVEITVRVRPKPATIETKEACKNLVVPKAKSGLKDIELEVEPQVVKFEFEIEQCGPTKAVWYFEDDQIEAENSEFIQWSCDNYFALTIPMASERHCGRYAIKVSNEMGYVKNDARLSMILKAKIASLAQEAPEYIEESCCIAPMFTKKLKSIDLLSGDIIRLSCRVMSEPEPKILWTRDGESLDPRDNNRKMKILNNFPNYELTISDASLKDIGKYSCLASNFLGFDTTDALITIDGKDIDDDMELDPRFEINRALARPINAPILKVQSATTTEVSLEWTDVSTNDDSKVIYSIDKQKFNKSNQWKSIKKDLCDKTCTLSNNDISSTESHLLRCVATSEFGYQVFSNLLTIEVRAKAPTIPIVKPTITFKDASCATISWQRGKCNGLSSEESFGKVFYCLEMKDNPKSSWQIVNNELINNEYATSLEPGVSYMFRVSAFNDHGTSEPTPSVITRIDRLKLVPDFSIDAPWLHVQGQPCLKWRAASVPEYCENCVPGIMPEYKVEFRSGRLSPWKIYQDNITQSQVFLTPQVVNSAQELRVSCRNKFGQNGPTRTYRLQANCGGKSDQDSANANKGQNIVNPEISKESEIVAISPSGLNLKWEPWCDKQNSRYVIQKKSTYSIEWTPIEPVIYGEDCFLDLKVSENFSRNLRILAIEDERNLLHDCYNQLTIPSKEQLVPTAPDNLKILVKIGLHELSWTQSINHILLDLLVSYTIQYKIGNNVWITSSDQVHKCSYTNEKINNISNISYRVSAKNAFGSSLYSNEIQVNTPLNVLANDQIIKSLRYFVIDYENIEIKWQLCDAVFDNGLSVDDLSFNVEKKASNELSKWIEVDSCAGRSAINVSSKFEEETLFRIQPFLDGERLTPSRIFRIYLTKDLFVPDMSFTKPEIITDSIKDYFIEWLEPNIECGFSPEGLEICSIGVMLSGIQYELQYYIEEITSFRRIRTKDIKSSQWITISDDIKENSYYWENPDPTQEYVFRVIPRNQFGEGQPSRVTKLRPQITIPDFSLVRLGVEDLSISSKSIENDVILSWIPPKVNPERYTPYSVDIQYRPRGSSSEEEWVTLLSNIKKSRVTLNELDLKIEYELRIVPVTEFGVGKPSMISRLPRRYEKDQASDARPLNTASSEEVTDRYVSLSQDVEMKFNKTYNIAVEELIWLKDNKPLILNDEKIKNVSRESDSASLLISNVKEEDFGTYSVLSKNNELLHSIKMIKADAPTFLNPPVNRSANLHENITVSFKIDAQPPAVVTWRKNWNKIYSSYRTNITEEKDLNRYSIKISKCILSDSGEYSVRAENVVGFVEVKFNLRIDGQPESKSIHINEGDVNDRYYVVKDISRGTYSTCKLMVEKSSRREFVGKVFATRHIGIGKMEFESMRDIRQRNIVELFDAVLNSSEYLSLVYEKLEGSLLADYITTLSHWNEQQAQMIIYQIVQALSHLHSVEVCHLDLQPCNIMITGRLFDTVKIFGFSNATKKEDFEKNLHQLVTSPFSAPELLKGEMISLKSDIWSLGILSLICLHGHSNMDSKCDPLYIDHGKGLLSAATYDFIGGCLKVNSQARLSSLQAMQHDWFTKTIIDYNASLDHLRDDIVKLMTYPEEMVPDFAPDMRTAIEKSLMAPKPKVTVDSIQSSPSISQLSSRASSVSRDGINYERSDLINEPSAEASITYGDIKDNIQFVDDKYVPNSARELLFTVPLKDQTFKPASFGNSINHVNLTCQLALSASDAISISWYKNQELLTDGSKIKLEVLSGGFLSCTIENPGESDAEIYRCVARSRSLRAETSARLLIGQIPPQPSQPSVLFINENDVLFKWMPNLSAADDIIYRIDLKEINKINEQGNWKTGGYTVDNRFIMEDFSDAPCVARVVAQNKYGFSPYSIASSAFQNESRKCNSSGRDHAINKKWMSSTRQSKDSNSLHDLIKDISSNEITMDIIHEYYTNQSNRDGKVKVLALNQQRGNYPDYVVQRNIEAGEKCPALDLCLRMKYYHFPIVYGAINELSIGLHCTIEEFVPGGDLISVLLARSWYSEFTVVTILRQLIETVQFLHANNIIHTDINPSNILIARRTNQLYDIKLIGLHQCRTIGVPMDSIILSHKVPHRMSTFQAPEFRYESITKNETDIWSIGTLAFLLLATQLPTIEDVCTESDVQCSTKNTNTLHLPTTYTHFRTPDLTLLTKFSKGARKFVYNTLKKNPSERGNADYWLAHSWFRQQMPEIAEMQQRRVHAAPLVEFMTSSN